MRGVQKEIVMALPLRWGLFEDDFLCRLEIDEWNNKRCAQALE